MRNAQLWAWAVAVSLLAGAPAYAQLSATDAKSATKCDNPNALGVARTVEIDTTGGPGFGFEHFRRHDFLRDREVVLTFDDGPWPTTSAVLKALAAECVKATFFVIGKHVTYYPEIVREAAAADHTVGTHTWSHKDLSAIKNINEAKAEIEKAVSAVKWAVEDTGRAAPFFRFPALRHPPELVTYLGHRNIAIFSTDMDSFDFKVRKPEEVVKSVMSKLQKHGKGIVLLHDFNKQTADAIPLLLAQLKTGGYKIVHMRPRTPVTSLSQYDEEILKDTKPPSVSQRPASSVVQDYTISAPPAAKTDSQVASVQPLASAAVPSPSIPSRRVALVVGNSSYQAVAALPNAQRDSTAIAAALRNVGFTEVMVKNNVTREELVGALRNFEDTTANAEWAVVYYAGHGIEMGGMNYLIPVDAKLKVDRDVQDEAVPLDRILSTVDGAKRLRLVILDACRDNPFIAQMRRSVATRSIGRGLGRIEPEGGVLVAYAAKHGQVAWDGDGNNSPFARALINRLSTPNLEINMLFRLVRDDVLAATGKKQEPFVYGSLPGENLYFVQR